MWSRIQTNSLTSLTADVTYLEDYCTQLIDGKIRACEKMKVQSWNLLERLHNPGQYHFDETIANKHIDFMERFCKCPSGNLGVPLKLQLFQKARFQALFGFVDDLDIRQYTECIIVEGRKNGKTTECAAVELDMLVNDKEGSPQIYNVATKRDQALLGYTAADKMRQLSPFLKKHIRRRTSDMYFSQNMGFIKALASDTSSMDGLDTHCAIIDELAAIKNRDLYDLIKQSTAARRQPLIFTISTNGYVRGSIFDSQYNYAAGVINGTIKDDRFLAFLYELDDPKEWTDPECYIKANPGLGTIKSIDKLNEYVEKAKMDPSFRPTVLVKDFNMPQTQASAWLSFEDIVNEQVIPMEELEHSYAIAGCDLSATTDLTAATLLLRKPEKEEIYVLQHYFLPQARIDALEQTESKEAPYKLWAEQGWLTICEGAAVDYSQVTQWFVSMVEQHDIRPLWVCYDRALSGYWVPEMESCGFDMEKTAQGPYTWSQPMKEMGAAFREHKIVYQNNPILRWCLANTAVKALNKDGIETIQPIKIQQNRRIDGTVSLLNAYVGYVKHFDEYMPYLR